MLTNRDFTLDDEEIQRVRQGDYIPPNHPPSESIEDILLESSGEEATQPSIDDLNISRPMKLRLKKLGFTRLSQIQKETTGSLMKKGMNTWDARDVHTAMKKIGMPMQKAEYGSFQKKEPRPRKFVEQDFVEQDEDKISTPLDSLDVSQPIKFRLRNFGLKRLNQIQKHSTSSLIELGMSKWDAQIVSAAMSRLGLPIQKSLPGSSPFHKPPQKLNRKVSGTKLTLHWTQTPEGKEKMAGIRAKAIQSRQEKAEKRKHWTQTPKGKKKMAEIATARYKKEGQTVFVAPPMSLRIDSKFVSDLNPIKVSEAITLKPKLLKLLENAGIYTLLQLLDKTSTQLDYAMKSRHFSRMVIKALEKRQMYLRREKEEVPVLTKQEAIDLPKLTGEEIHERQEYFGYIIGYAHSDILQRIGVIAESTGGKISEAELASRLARLLQGEKMR